MINLDNTWSWSLLCFIPFLFCNAIDWNSTNATSHGIESWSITIEGGVKWTKKPRSYKRWLVASKCSPQDLKRRSSVSSDCRAATRITLSGQPLKSFRCLAQTTLVKTITVMLHLHFDAAEWNTRLSYVYSSICIHKIKGFSELISTFLQVLSPVRKQLQPSLYFP